VIGLWSVNMVGEGNSLLPLRPTDVYRNNSKTALIQIINFCEVLNNTNIILLDITHRYDLIENSCVNKEI
jgi:hypothetical protein